MTKLAILCPLQNFDRTYSVAGVVHDQLITLSNFYDVTFITTDDFTDHSKLPSKVTLKTFPRTTSNLEVVTAQLTKHLNNVSTCIVHDVLFVDCFLDFNQALRNTNNKNTLFLFFSHSAPSFTNKTNKNDLNRIPWNGKAFYIALNRMQTKDLAQMYQVPESLVRVCPNPIDPCQYFNFDTLTSILYKEFKLWNSDHICVYPTRITPEKQIDKLIKLFSKFEMYNRQATLIIAGSFSNNIVSKQYLKSLENLAKDLDFKNLIITPTLQIPNHNLSLGLDIESVRNLLQYSDIFVLPSISEACSLSMLEAGLSKNAMVLNEDLYSLQDFGGQKVSTISSLKAHYLQFGSLTKNITNYHPSEDKWYEDHAKLLLEEIQSNQSLNFFRFVRKEHNPFYIYDNFLKDLIV